MSDIRPANIIQRSYYKKSVIELCQRASYSKGMLYMPSYVYYSFPDLFKHLLFRVLWCIKSILLSLLFVNVPDKNF